jgi:predicted amidohydrolase
MARQATKPQTGTRQVTIGMLKAMPTKWDVEGNWEILLEQFRRHRGDGLDVFITPECFLDGYAVTQKNWSVKRFAAVAQQVNTSVYVRRARQLARRASCAIVLGFTELLDGQFYNCALLIGPDGKLLGKYHKTHLQNHDHRFSPGRSLPVFQLPWGKVGMVICADRRWPESIRALRLQGAECCLMPTYGMHHLDNEWWMRTRSYENQMFICFTHPEEALITDPHGGIAAKLASNQPDVLVHRVDLDEVDSGNHLADRRPELYGILADPEHPSRQREYVAPRFKA